jgi:hypothetical protein
MVKYPGSIRTISDIKPITTGIIAINFFFPDQRLHPSIKPAMAVPPITVEINNCFEL